MFNLSAISWNRTKTFTREKIAKPAIKFIRNNPKTAIAALSVIYGIGIIYRNRAQVFRGQSIIDLESIIDLANRVNTEKKPLKDLNLSKTQLKKLAPYLTFVDCRGESFEGWSASELEEFIKSCSSLNQLFINSSKIEVLPALPNCKSLHCSSCTGLESLPALPVAREVNCSGCMQLNTSFFHRQNCRVFLPQANELEQREISVVRLDVKRSDFDTKSNLQEQFLSFAQKLSSVTFKKVRLFVHFKNTEGRSEAGIDYGGLAKEYLRLLISASLKPDIGLFSIDEKGNFLCRLLPKDNESLKNLERLGKVMMAACLSTNTRNPP